MPSFLPLKWIFVWISIGFLFLLLCISIQFSAGCVCVAVVFTLLLPFFSLFKYTWSLTFCNCVLARRNYDFYFIFSLFQRMSGWESWRRDCKWSHSHIWSACDDWWCMRFAFCAAVFNVDRFVTIATLKTEQLKSIAGTWSCQRVQNVQRKSKMEKRKRECHHSLMWFRLLCSALVRLQSLSVIYALQLREKNKRRPNALSIFGENKNFVFGFVLRFQWICFLLVRCPMKWAVFVLANLLTSFRMQLQMERKTRQTQRLQCCPFHGDADGDYHQQLSIQTVAWR